MMGILEDGVKKKVFRSDVDMYLVRDIILGTLDWECLNCLASREIEETVTGLEDILDLILPMITFQAASEREKLDKSSRILKAAEIVFAEKGYIQATISDIAKISNVSEGTIYGYFKNKQELLLSIAEKEIKDHIDNLKEIFEIKTPLRKLRRFIRFHFLQYLTRPNFSKVFLLHIQLNKMFYESSVYKIFQQYTDIITEILNEGKDHGSIRRNVNTRIFKNLLLGAFSHMALRWLFLKKEAEANKTREIDEIVLFLTRAVATNQNGYT
jgi:TetR/AcrR family fatty acid metabolism transcriptional regulator